MVTGTWQRFPESSHVFSYLAGWLNVDFIDNIEEDVISTNRQSLNWELPIIASLKDFLVAALRKVITEWRVKRNEASKKAVIDQTNIDTEKWLSTLPDNLKSDVRGKRYAVFSFSLTIATPSNLVRGAVLGRITASGKYILSASAAADGSQTPEAILGEDTDASGGDKEAIVYLSGEFNELALTLGAGHTAASISLGLRNKSIFLTKNQGA